MVATKAFSFIFLSSNYLNADFFKIVNDIYKGTTIKLDKNISLVLSTFFMMMTDTN